jgi:hypothetical protein
MKQLMIYTGANAGDTSALDPSDSIHEVSIAATTAQALIVPTGAKFVMFSASDDFYVRYDGTAATIPSSATWASGSVELNPAVRIVAGGQTISVIAPVACVIIATFYS